MEKKSVFANLVAGLHAEERKDLLAKLRAGMTQDLAAEVQWTLPVEEEAVGWESSYQQMGFFQKLWVRIQGFFTGRSLQEIVETELLHYLEKTLARLAPGFCRFRLETFGTPFYQALKELSDQLKFLRNPFQVALEGQKAEFVAFFVGLTRPDLQARLMLETDLWLILEKSPELATKDIKLQAEKQSNEILQELDPAVRKSIYQEFQALYQLWRLAMVNLDPLLALFSTPNVEGAPDHAPFRTARPFLEDLYQKLAAVRLLSSRMALEAVFLFYYQDRLSEPDDQLELLLAESVSKALVSLRQINGFARNVPLAKIVCYLRGQPTVPTPVTGGFEDWFVLLRRFWEGKLERDFQKFARFRAEKMLSLEVLGLLEVTAADWLAGQPYPAFPGSVAGHGAKTLAFVRLFWEHHYLVRIRNLFLLLLQEGQFYKKGEKDDLSQVFRGLEAVPEAIAGFGRNFGPEGIWGSFLLDFEQLPVDLQGNRLREVWAMAAEVVDQLFEVWTPLFRKAGDYLKLFSQGDPAGKRDLISNLAEIAGRSNPIFRRELEQAAGTWGRFFLLFRDLGPFD